MLNLRKKKIELLLKKDTESLLDRITKRNRVVDASISLFIAFLLTYALYMRIKLHSYSSDDKGFIKIFLASYFLAVFIPLYRSVNIMALKKTIEVFKEYGAANALLEHYGELKIKSGWYILHIFLAMVIFFLVFAITR